MNYSREKGKEMCTRFVYNGDDMITGFNFDIDLAVWDHKVITEKERFYIGIRMPDHRYHSFHGVKMLMEMREHCSMCMEMRKTVLWR